MSHDQRGLWRAAACLREQLQRRRDSAVTGWAQFAEDPFVGIDRARRLHRMLWKATRWQRHAAADRLRKQLAIELQNLDRMLGPTINFLSRPLAPVPSMRELFGELAAIEEEFEELIIELNHRTVAVRTDPIQLEGIYLGPFEIRVFLNDLASSSGPCPYTVAAMDPHPAASADHVTHPHVSDERLCAGDATGPINRALETGRLSDFFLLVRSVLTTYNPSSPYVALDEWDGEPCSDCGVRTHEDNRCLCDRCERDYCDECMSFCRPCAMPACHGCVSVCDLCGQPCCGDCLSPCDQCSDMACPACRDNGVCVSCSEDKETDDDPESNDNPQPATATREQAGPQPRVA